MGKLYNPVDEILEYLAKYGQANSLDLANILQEDHQRVVGAIKSLEAIGDFVITTIVPQKKWELTKEGQRVVEHGSHEAIIYNAVPSDGITQAEIMKIVPFAKVGFSKALVAGWIKLDKIDGTTVVKRSVSSIKDITQDHLKNLDSIPDNIKAEYKKRKLLQEVVVKSIIIKKGPKFSTQMEKQETELTAEMVANGSWKNKKFKPYNFEALGIALQIGHLHPLLKVRSEFRKIFLEMGFAEMPTNNYVENSFWNFDALFQPQQHPARDAHDTFFISEPSTCEHFPDEYVEKVRKVHSEGNYGSQGYRYEWKLDEAKKNLLRTHTTAVSARMLYNLMKQGEFKPVKYFSIDRVFRNETLDATHLAEFHQIEGVVADYGLTLGNLIGTLYEFFKKLGITELEFKPAYNPYTEPSMEIFCYHTGLRKLIEIGNSGVFRPEMLLPMGIPEGVNVIAWGLSLERPTMIKYGLNNIRDLVGPKVDLEMVYNNPLCRLYKDSAQISSSKRTVAKPADMCSISTIEDNRNKRVLIEKQNLVIFCDPRYPLYSLETILQLARCSLKPMISIHIHSSVSKFPAELEGFCLNWRNIDPKDAFLSLVLIWKNVGIDPIIQLPNMRQIVGEINVLRYINRLIESTNSDVLIYEKNGPHYANKIDSGLEKLHRMSHRFVDVPLDKSCKFSKNTDYILGDKISIVDILFDSLQKSRRMFCKV